MESFLDYGAIDWYGIYRLTDVETMNLDWDYQSESDSVDTNTGSDFADEFVKFLNNDQREYHLCYNGLHYGVSSEFDYGGGSSPTALDGVDDDDDWHYDSAFTMPHVMILGTDGPDGRPQNFAIQEMLHGFVSSTLVEQYDDGTWDSSKEPLMDYSESWFHSDHSLGEVEYSYWGDNPVTPMATIWTGEIRDDDEASKARCGSSTDWEGAYTQQMTSCTKEAVKITANNDDYQDEEVGQ